MQTDILNVSKKETRELEAWVRQTYGFAQNVPDDVSLLILYRLHRLEQKIDRIEHQTKTHWAN